MSHSPTGIVTGDFDIWDKRWSRRNFFISEKVCVLYVVVAEAEVTVQYRASNNATEPDISTTTDNTSINAWFGIWINTWLTK